MGTASSGKRPARPAAQPSLSPRRLPRAQREQQILDTAHAQFAERGFAAVTMDDVAAAVGVTKPLLYNYWGNKDRLYLACLEREAERLRAAVGVAVAEAESPADALNLATHAFFAFIDTERGAFRVLFDETLPRSGEIAGRVEEFRRQLGDLIAGTLLAQIPVRRRKQARIEVEALSAALLGAAEALGRWWLASGEIPAAAAADLLIDTVTPGLEARSQPARADVGQVAGSPGRAASTSASKTRTGDSR
jgi:AcrR family transcriptional regulator